MIHFFDQKPEIAKLFKVLPQKNEEAVLASFMKQKAKLAIARSDVLQELYNTQKMTEYRILGKVSGKAVLYFATKDNMGITSVEKGFKHRRISVGVLGDRAETYLKGVLKHKQQLYNTNFISQDAYRSISSLKRGEIDGFFLFASDSYEKIFSQYLTPYPESIKSVLNSKDGLYCDNERYCYATYYLIASDSIGKGVMENLYVQMQPLLSKNKELSSQIGKYYIYTGLKKEKITAKKELTAPKESLHQFHRTPWMDLAINEAIKGKGSPENVLPMLDLSYKYIRFAKGDQGITTAPNDNKEGSWCAAYICWTLNKSGYTIHPKGRMASQSFRYFNNKLYRKIDTPIFGAITLYTNTKKPAHGHVGYLFGKTKRGKYIVLGGNQSNRLKFAAYAERFGSYKLKGFYVPIDYTIKKEDRLTKKDIYTSARSLNKKYGLVSGKGPNTVR